MNKSILTKREMEVIRKKIDNRRLNQQDSNYLSRYVRPKLKAIKTIDPNYLLKRLSYNPSSINIERKIKKVILSKIKNVIGIIIYGSAIQSGYSDYRDIDVLAVVKNKELNKWDKWKLANEIEKGSPLNLDIQIIDEKTLNKDYIRNPSLSYQLRDSKIIYGKVKIPKKSHISKLDLRMKLDWSDLDFIPNNSKEIYDAIRNTILVKLLMKKVIDNNRLLKEIENGLGIRLIEKLKKNTVSVKEKEYALEYLKNITRETRKKLIDSKWENLEILKV